MDVEWKETYEILKRKHKEVIKTVELAKQNEKQENKEVALINYKMSIALIDEALSTPVALPDDPDDVDDTWQLGLKIVKMLKRTRGDVMHSIAMLSPSTSHTSIRNKVATEPPSNGSEKRPRTFMELAEALQNLEYSFNDPKTLPSVLELLFSCEGITFYHINVNGEVTTTDESSTLRIVRLDQDLTQNFDATYFMQIIRSSAAEEIQHEVDDNENAEFDNNLENDADIDDLDIVPSAKKVRENSPTKAIDSSLIYPLVAGVSPCFRTEFGAFIFPDIQSDENGAAIGIVVPKSTDAIVYEILEAILHGIVRQKVEEEEDEDEDEEHTGKRVQRHASERISDNIVQTSCFISNSLVMGTQQVGKLISFTTPYIISKITGAPENAPVSHNVVNGIEIAKTATGLAVGVTGYLAQKVGSASVALGRFMAPHVHAQGSKMLSNTMGYSTDEAADKMSGVLTVAAGALEGFGTVYNGLEKSAGILGKNLSDNSVKIIEHKYGAHAADLAHDTFDTVGNMINLSQNMSLITPKGLAKKTMKGTGKAIIGDFRPKVPKTNYAPAGSLYPDLTEFSRKLQNQNESNN